MVDAVRAPDAETIREGSGNAGSPRSVRHTTRRARELLARGGGRAVLVRAARRLLSRVCTWVTYRFYQRDLVSQGLEEFVARIPLETRVATVDDFERFRDVFEQAGVSPRKIEERVLNGDVCFLGVSEGRLLHFSWLTLRSARIPALGLTVTLRPGEVYGYNAYTVPEARGLGVQPAVAVLKTSWEQARQLRHHISSVVADNYSAHKIYGRAHLPATRPGPTVRCFRFAGLRGRLLTGLGAAHGPRFDFPARTVVRRLGPLGIWVSPPG
jgi:hypothetical protein